jgi:hypothetical protein
LDIVEGSNGFLELKPLPINGIQAEIRLSSNPMQLLTIKPLVPEIHSVLFKLDELYREFINGKPTSYFMVQELLKRFDTPELNNGKINEGFLMDLIIEINKRIARIEAMIPNVEISLDEWYVNEVSEERKAKYHKEIEEFVDIPSQIHYAEIEKAKYLRDASGSLLQASGRFIGSGEPRSLFMDRYIDYDIEIRKLKLSGPEKSKGEFKGIFNPNNNAYQVCLDLLEDLEITISGNCRLTEGKAGPLIGAIAAMKDTTHFFKQDFTDMGLLEYFNSYLNTKYSTINKRSNEFKATYPEAKAFLKANFKK